MKQVAGSINKFDCSFVHDGSYKLCLLGTAPADAKMVAIEIHNSAVSFHSGIGVRPIGGPNANEIYEFDVGPQHRVTQIHRIFRTGSPNFLPFIQLKAPTGSDADLSFSVVGFLGGDGVETLPESEVTGWTVDYEEGTWLEFDISPLLPAEHRGNVEAVVGFIRHEGGIGGNKYGDLRANGSTWDEETPIAAVDSGRWQKFDSIIKVDDDDIIEVRFGSGELKGFDNFQQSWVYLVGYILRDIVDDGAGDLYRYRAIQEPILDGLVGTSAWDTFDVESATSVIVNEVYWRAKMVGVGTANWGMRQVGSSSPVLVGKRDEEPFDSRLIALDGKNVGYFFQPNTGADIITSWIFGYLEGPQPEQATNPSPINGAVDTGTAPLLAWTAGDRAASHDVYFGTNPAPGAGEFQGNRLGTTFDPGLLLENTTYYWRVDEVNGVGTTIGVIWSFTVLTLGCLEFEAAIESAVNMETELDDAVFLEADLISPIEADFEIVNPVDYDADLIDVIDLEVELC